MYVRSKQDFQLVRLQHKLQSLAREHRKNQTLAEQEVWRTLRAKRLHGLKFRRQHPLFQYIVDFYCHTHRLIVEIDGPIHDQQHVRDQIRDTFFKSKGYTIIRLTNQEVLENKQNLPKIIATILSSKRRGNLP